MPEEVAVLVILLLIVAGLIWVFWPLLAKLGRMTNRGLDKADRWIEKE